MTYDLVAALLLSAMLVGLVEAVWGRSQFTEALHGTRQGIYIALASIAGSLLGFAVTTVTIVTAFVRSPGLRLVRESRHHGTLYLAFFSTIRCLALATVTALVALVVDRDICPLVWASYAVFATTTVAILRLYRCVWLLEKVVCLATRPRNG